MKIKSALVAILLITGLAPGVAQATERPVVESFTFTPNDLDLISANTNVVFELVVSHPSGIKNISTLLTLTGPNGSSLATYLTRTDSPINLALSQVTFKGALVVPQTVAAGKSFSGRLGNLDTRVATINQAAELERAGLDVAFEFPVFVGNKATRFVDLVALNPAVGLHA